MAKINIEFDGKIYSVDETTLAPLASPLERALIQQLAGTGAVIRLGGTDYNVDANKLASARNVLTDHFGNVAGTDSKVTVNGTEYGLSKTKLQGATDKMHETLSGVSTVPASEGLKFKLNEDGVSYSLIGRGTCTDTAIVIPDTYEGLPVTALEARYEYIYELGVVVDGRLYGTFEAETDICSVTIPDSVTSIGRQVFMNCRGLTSVTIGNSVTSIEKDAFWGCTALTSITVDENNTVYKSIDGNLYSKDGTTLIQYAAGKPNTSFTTPDDVTSIGDYACQDCDNLKSVTIGNGVTSIGFAAFDNCSSLRSVTIGNSVTSIGYHAFSVCPVLTDIYVNKSENSIPGAPWGATDAMDATVHWNSTGPEN